jgi:putative two-component system response regulator
VYDALTSERVYKPAVSHAEAAELIRRDSGYHFDPKLVQAFEQCPQEFERIRRAST